MKNLQITIVRCVSAALVTLMAQQALATGGFYCETQKKDLTFAISGVTSRGFGAAIVNASGSIQGTVGKERVDYAFTRSEISQYWSLGKDFKLNLYSEKENAKGQLEQIAIIIETTSVDLERFTGKVRIEAIGSTAREHGPAVRSAKIDCSVE